MRIFLMTGLLALSASSMPALAQVSPQEQSATLSQPGKAQKTEIVTATALITSIDKATRVIALKTADGKVIEFVCGPEVRNFDQLKLNDEVAVEYMRSLSLTLQKVKTDDKSNIAVTEAAVRSQPGEKPGAAAGRNISAIAEVIDVNPAASTITLKGPRGNVVELDVKNPDQFKVVKVGDQVKVEYTETFAVAVKPAAAKKAK